MSAATPDPTGIAIPQSSSYLSNRQVKDLQADIAGLESNLNDPKARIEDRGEVVKQLGRIKRDLQVQAPPETTPMQRDTLAREERELLEEIKVGMPSFEEMRKCPPGAIGKHMQWEKKNKPKIMRWKNIRKVLNSENDDVDLSNLEMHRPRMSTLNMDNAMIAGKDYFLPPDTQQYKEGYERTFGGGEATAKQIGELEEKIARLEALMTAKPAVSSKAPRNKHIPVMTMDFVAPCGRPCRSEAGRLAHRRNCDTCKSPEALAAIEAG